LKYERYGEAGSNDTNKENTKTNQDAVKKESSSTEADKLPASLKEVLSRVKSHQANGKKAFAMGVLMDFMESSYDTLDPGDKLLLHERVASLSHDLKWL
jgi:glutamine synthetase